MTLWLTSDQHWGHTNILKYCNRPFADIVEHDLALADRWRLRVKPADTVLHLGDVTLASANQTDTVDIIRSLPGRVVLVPGNHDRQSMLELYASWGWDVRKPFIAVDCFFTHKPCPALGERLIVHGHTHGMTKGNIPRPGYVDVGVDAQPDYAPVNAVFILGPHAAIELEKELNVSAI